MDVDGDLNNASYSGQSMEHRATGGCENKSFRLVAHDDHEGTLDSIWYKATGICQSSQLKTFLRKKGKLSSLHVHQSTSCNFFIYMLILNYCIILYNPFLLLYSLFCHIFSLRNFLCYCLNRFLF
jgi:hypothetical protein